MIKLFGKKRKKKVWALTFSPLDFADCNGVFSSMEKAEKAFWEHMNRNVENWRCLQLEATDNEEWAVYTFDYDYDTQSTEQVYVEIQPYFIDEI
jgi:hypothetical protein